MIESDPKDKRFADPAWRQNEIFDFIKQSYLLSARYINDVVTHVDGLEPKTAQKIDFYSRQFVNALSPSNFALTNPEVLRRTRETGGENLVRGLNNLLNDLEQGRGNLRIKMADTEAFKVGENIAVSEGKVVYQNALMQLIQYAPATRDGVLPAGGDFSALDQQILYPRFAAEELAGAVSGLPGAYRVHGELGESGCAARGQEFR